MDEPEFRLRVPSILREGGEIARRARQMVLAQLQGRPPQGSPLPTELPVGLLDWVFVTVYFNGGLRGCIGSTIRRLDDDLCRLAGSALRDSRFEAVPAKADGHQLTVTASLLYNTCDLGDLPVEQVARRLRRSNQGLIVRQGRRSGLLLPQVACHSNLNRQEYVQRVIVKAGLGGPPYWWHRFDCTTWMALEGQAPRKLVNGFPLRDADSGTTHELVQRLTPLLADYLLRCQRPDGTFFTRYQPIQDRYCEGPPAQAAWLPARAGRLLNRKDLIEASYRLAKNPGEQAGALRGAEPHSGEPQTACRLISKLQCFKPGEQDDEACRKTLLRLDQLILQEQDSPLLPNPQRALGGLRSSSRRSEVLTEEVAQALQVLLDLQ